MQTTEAAVKTMPSLLQRIKSNRLIKHSSIYFIGSMVAAVCNYLYQALLGRFLQPAEYGVVASLISIAYLMSIASSSILTVTMRYTAGFKATNQWGKIHSLLLQLNKKILIVALAMVTVLIFSSKVLAVFLKLPSITPVFILSGALLFGLVIPVNRGVMQGLQDFTRLTFNISIEALLKVMLVVILIFLGLTVNGAIWAIFAAVFVAYVLSFFPLKKVLSSENEPEHVGLKEVIVSSFPVLAAFLFITLLYNQDVILVKHFFGARQAGEYAGLALMGKIIFFASMPVTAAMFPMVSGAREAEERHEHLLIQSLALVLLIALGINTIYFLFPKVFIAIFFGSQYLGVSSYLGYFGLVMVLLSLINTFVQYFLASHKVRFIFFLASGTVLGTLLLWFFHNSIGQVVMDLLITMTLLIIFMIVFYLADKKDSGDKVFQTQILQ